jgi:hypothetical protein
MQTYDIAVKLIRPKAAPTPKPTPPPTPPPPPSTCIDIGEDSKGSLGCPAGQTIASVDFASFGMYSDMIYLCDFQRMFTLSNGCIRFSQVPLRARAPPTISRPIPHATPTTVWR